MKKRISKTIVAIAIVTAFLMPLMGNTALADSEEEIYYFNSRDTVGEPCEEWTTNPDNMIDGNPDETFASTQLDGDVQLLDGNTLLKPYPAGTITKVEIRANGYYTSSGGSADIILRAVFSAGDGENHRFDAPLNNPDYSEWFVITDEKEPSTWNWDDVNNLDLDVEADGSDFTLYCSIVQIRVTYTPA